MGEALGGLVQARSSKSEECMGPGGMGMRPKACVGLVGERIVSLRGKACENSMRE